MRRIVLAGLVVLAGCENRPRMYTEAEIEDIATDAASDTANPRIQALSERIDELEQQFRQERADRLQADAEASQARANDLAQVDQIIEHYNDHLRRYHGAVN